MDQPNVIILAGPNGAGKSTISNSLIRAAVRAGALRQCGHDRARLIRIRCRGDGAQGRTNHAAAPARSGRSEGGFRLRDDFGEQDLRAVDRGVEDSRDIVFTWSSCGCRRPELAMRRVQTRVQKAATAFPRTRFGAATSAASRTSSGSTVRWPTRGSSSIIPSRRVSTDRRNERYNRDGSRSCTCGKQS